uniref:Uncharacterized protein n=1 Tax=Physcomitrium patens TaxID=3218 RepID=A0A2K1KK72_PHYPA|nr:hypothetical protein PHYPA_007858 [Physcomitrium patens]
MRESSRKPRCLTVSLLGHSLYYSTQSLIEIVNLRRATSRILFRLNSTPGECSVSQCKKVRGFHKLGMIVA